MTEPSHEDRQPIWYGWAAPADRPATPPAALAYLARTLGIDLDRASPVVKSADIALPAPALPDGVLDRLANAIGAQWVSTTAESRIRHAAGRGYLDLVRLRRGDLRYAPDAVLSPAVPAEINDVLAVCAEHGVAVIPFGGGTSVVGGVTPVSRPAVALDLGRLDRLVEVDPVSMTATLQAGMRGPEVEQALRAHGFTLGHFPQSFRYSTVGGWLATRSAGQASAGYGRADDLVVGLRCATPVGELVLGRGPASAAGPRLLDLLVGSEGVYGVITEATVVVRPAPEHTRYEGWSFPDLPTGIAAFRALAQRLGPGVMPDVCRLSDPAETQASVLLAGAGRAARAYLALRGHRHGCRAVLGWEGTGGEVGWRRRAAVRLIREHGGTPLGTAPGRAWLHGRYDAPYLRDTLLDHGVLAETVETATSWSQLPLLYERIRTALTTALGERALVLTHVSHLYRSGASLYTTVLAEQDADDPVGQWTKAKRAVTDAIMAGGGTLTHHHAVGADHAAWLPAEVGEVGMTALRAVKQALDPAGVLNPGVLLPDAAGSRPTGGTPTGGTDTVEVGRKGQRRAGR